MADEEKVQEFSQGAICPFSEQAIERAANVIRDFYDAGESARDVLIEVVAIIFEELECDQLDRELSLKVR